MKIQFCFLLTLLLSACSNSEVDSFTEHQATSRTDDCRRRYIEMACVVNNCAGTLCTEGLTINGCKNLKPCTPIPGGCSSSAIEILSNLNSYCTEYADWMLNNDYIDECNWQASFSLCETILTDRANSLE